MKKETVKIVIVGHVDHGKSTLIGRLLLETDSLPKEKIAEIKRISKELGKEAELAYLSDQLKEEREKNITIDTTQIFFKTRKRNFVIIDTPGHVEFLKNMITGASLAEAGVLLVDAQEGVKEQTRRHAYLLSMLGLNKIIVIFNKMDLVNYEEKKFAQVKAELLKFLKSLNINPDFLIPASAREGDNISARSPKINWYKGPSFLKALDLLKVKTKAGQKPLRMPIQDVYEIDGKKVIVGMIAAGEMKQGQEVILLPTAEKTKINAIKFFRQKKTRAQAGENIGLTLDKNLNIKRGEIIVQQEDQPQPTNRFRGNVFWMANKPLHINKPLTLRCATQEVECVAEKIERRINSSTLEVIEEKAKELKLNEAGIVTFKTTQPIIAENFSFIEELGRFVIEHNYDLQGAGIITQADLRTCD